MIAIYNGPWWAVERIQGDREGDIREAYIALGKSSILYDMPGQAPAGDISAVVPKRASEETIGRSLYAAMG